MSDKAQMTMKDIARELGVSVATVSRALKDSPNISKAQRDKIQQFAREHNYTPNKIAEQLRHSKLGPSRVIGVIVPQLVHYYFSTVLSGIEQVTSQRGYRIVVSQSNEQYEREREICQSFYQNKVCGIIVSQAKDTTNYDHFRRLLAAGVPLVFYDRICAGINCSRVVVDDYQGSYKAVDYLIKTGCRRVAFYGTNLNMEIGRNRYNGYRDAIQHNGLPFDQGLVHLCDNRDEAARITPGVLRAPNRPDGFFAVNDDTAVGILYSAREVGLHVPDDVEICGFTNGERAITCDPMLTTIDQRGAEVGREAASVLIDTVEGKYAERHVEKRIVKTRLVVRGTTRPLPQ